MADNVLSYDQVPRKLAYAKAHPDVTITYCRPFWIARYPIGDGKATITRVHLRSLLDTLDALGLPEAKTPDTPSARQPRRSG